MNKRTLIFGLILGIVSSLFTWIFYRGILGLWLLTALGMVLPIVFSIVAIIDHRKRHDGESPFAEIIKMVVIIGFLGSLISGVFGYIFVSSLDEKGRVEMTENLVNSQFEVFNDFVDDPDVLMQQEDELRKRVNEMTSFKSILISLPINILFYGFIGVILGLIFKRN